MKKGMAFHKTLPSRKQRVSVSSFLPVIVVCMLSLNYLVLIASLLYPACNVELCDGSSIFVNNAKAALAKMLTENAMIQVPMSTV
jgi:hypothetical protein